MGFRARQFQSCCERTVVRNGIVAGGLHLVTPQGSRRQQDAVSMQRVSGAHRNLP